MYVIPVINCKDIECVQKKVALAKTFLEPQHFIHIDVTDGLFAPKVWNDSEGWKKLSPPFAAEVHLMMERPEDYLGGWVSAGVKRCIVHVESLTKESFHEMNDLCERNGVELMLSSNPDTTIEEIEPYIQHFAFFQVLAVRPGPAGQPFMDSVLEKIRFLREQMPDATIEVDGGMNPATARLAEAAGADTIVSDNYIFSGADPKAAYEELKAIR